MRSLRDEICLRLPSCQNSSDVKEIVWDWRGEILDEKLSYISLGLLDLASANFPNPTCKLVTSPNTSVHMSLNLYFRNLYLSISSLLPWLRTIGGLLIDPLLLTGKNALGNRLNS